MSINRKRNLYVVFDKSGIKAIIREKSIAAAKSHFSGHRLKNDLMFWCINPEPKNKTFCVNSYPSWLLLEWKAARHGKGLIKANSIDGVTLFR